ncbi:MAG: hypothetical protein IT438_16815 [Phycisphaerales bacterium]|nr:hypothetical protein [Phycisphaerales bacterium]
MPSILRFDRTANAIAALAAIGVPLVAAAQDSVSNSPGLPGDAVSAYAVSPASEQVNDFVVDLAPMTSSWGGRYSIGPVVKAGASAGGQYFDQLIGAQAVSARFSSGPMLRSSYPRWTVPGQGVNADRNDAPGSTLSAASRTGKRFGLAFMEFGYGPDAAFGTPDDQTAIIASIIELQPSRPSRLFVSRISALTGKPVSAADSTASLGLGAIDAAGNTLVLADDHALNSPQQITQRQYVRVRAAARTASLVNALSLVGAADAPSTDIVRSTATSMTTPAQIPSSIGIGGRPVALGLDFNADYLFEQAPNATSATKSYLPGSAGSSRGGLTFIPHAFAAVAAGASNAGTGLCLVRTDSNTRTRGIEVFGINTDGSLDGTLQVQLPIIAAQMLDPTDNWSPSNFVVSPSVHEFTGYAGQAPFRGGTAQVASVVLPGGSLLAAAVVTPTTGSLVPQSGDNYLVVATITPGGSTSWATAAHTGNSLGSGAGGGGISKVILGDNGADGFPGTADAGEGDGIVDTGAGAWIGRIARLSEVFPAQTGGPSISCPAFDLRGNLYFMATVAMKTSDGSFEYTSALLRGNRDTTVNGYRLELLARLGDVLPGLNSGLNYQIQSMSFADADSVSSGGMFSGNIVQDGLGPNPGTPANAAYGSPLALGALTFRAKIVYDVDADGLFADPTSGGSNSHDQAYNVAMVIVPRPDVGDFNFDGAKTVQDLFDFLAAYFSNGPGGDWNADGSTSVQDIFDFLAAYFAP